MKDVQKRIEEINKELQRHDEAYEQLEEDLQKVEHEYTKVLIQTHIQTIINNVIHLKEELEQLQKENRRIRG
jgi:archaellum component FlaC